MEPWLVEVRPVQWWLTELLSGRLGMDEVPPAVASWSQHAIYQGAREIVMMDTQDERRAALGRVPVRIRPYVEDEVQRLWPMRRCL